jgi:outer membrane protein TolC
LRIPFLKILVCIIFLVLPAVGLSPSCAETLTYKTAIRDALHISARIKVKVEDVNISDATYRQNFAGLYPEISINSRFERYENLDKRPGQGLDTISGEVIGGGVSAWRSSIYLWGQYYISHWYKKRLEANYYEKLIDARGYDCDAEVKRVLKELTDIYSALAEGDIKLKYGSEIVTRLQAVLSLKMKAFAGGQVSYEDVVKAEAEVASAEKEIAAIRKEFKENLERLYSYTGKAYGENVEVERFISDGKKQFADVPRLIEETPEYKARMRELEALRFKEKAAANNFWPDISLYGRYDYYGNNVDSMNSSMRDIRESSYAAGMFITLPLFDGGVRKWERKRNLYEIRKQEETINAVMEEKNRDIKTLAAGYAELSRALRHYRKLADQYQKVLEITQKAHTLGERSVMDIAEMEKETLTVERDLKVTEHAMAAHEKRLAIETDYKNFITEHYGNGACKR